MDAFQKSGTPFKLDIEPVKNVQDIYNDPAITKALSQIPNAIIVTDDDMQKIIKPELREEFLKLTEGLSYTGDITKETHARLSEIEKQIFQDITAFSPKLAQALHSSMGVTLPDNATDVQRFSLLSEMLDRNGTLTDYGYGMHLLKNDQKENVAAMIKLPSEANFENYFEHKIERVTDLDVKPAPGTLQQQAALIVAHELEHGLGQIPNTVDYYLKVNQAIDDNRCNNLGFDLRGNIVHTTELESTLAEVHALRDTVPKELLEYHAASYIATFHSFHMSEDATDRHPLSIDIDKPGDAYRTIGFQMYDYIQTGELPDYAESTANVNNFFAKTRALFDGAVQMRSAESGGTQIQIEPTIPVTMFVVKDALKNDLYTPAEAQVAHTFLETMENALGIQTLSNEPPVDTSAHISSDVGAQTKTAEYVVPAEEAKPIIFKF